MKTILKTIIQERLTQEFSPIQLQVEDESWQHGGGPDAQSHFKIVIVSPAFSGLKLLARHRKVQSVLAEVISQIRALSLHTLTPDEWAIAKEQNSSFRSPGCHNKT